MLLAVLFQQSIAEALPCEQVTIIFLVKFHSVSACLKQMSVRAVFVGSAPVLRRLVEGFPAEDWATQCSWGVTSMTENAVLRPTKRTCRQMGRALCLLSGDYLALRGR